MSAGRLTAACRDLTGGLGEAWIWGALALQDIGLRHRGSYLGPLWITLNTAVTVAAMTAIFPAAFHVRVAAYVPYLAISLVLWQFLSGLIAESCATFLSAEMINQVPFHLSVHVFRLVSRNVMAGAYNFIVVAAALLWFHVSPTFRQLEVFPALALYILNGVWLSLVLGMLSARYRDVTPIITSVMQLAFFITPVFWPLEAAGQWRWLIELNPFFAAIDIVRAPLLGAAAAPHSWTIMMIVTAAGCAGGVGTLALWRTRVPFWV